MSAPRPTAAELAQHHCKLGHRWRRKNSRRGQMRWVCVDCRSDREWLDGRMVDWFHVERWGKTEGERGGCPGKPFTFAKRPPCPASEATT